MQTQCPKCGGVMEVQILSRPMKLVYKIAILIIVLGIVLGLAGLLIYTVGLWQCLNGLLGLIASITVIAWLARFLKDMFSTIILPQMDWNGAIAQREQEEKRLEWERERQRVEYMMHRDPSRVWMYCQKCGPIR